jgi:hypothetical protein
MANSLEKVTATYSTLLQRLAKTSTNYKALDEFLGKATDHSSQTPAKFTVVHIPSGLPISPGIQFDQFEGTANLAQELEQPEEKSRAGYSLSRMCALRQ